MAYAKEYGCDTMVLTANGEPLQNIKFLLRLAGYHDLLGVAGFHKIEIQTTGSLLFSNRGVLKALKALGVSTVSLSVCDPWSDVVNDKIIGRPERVPTPLLDICDLIKKWGFILRLSYNMIQLDNFSLHQYSDFLGYLSRAASLGADQITFKRLHALDYDCPQREWVLKNGVTEKQWRNLLDDIKHRCSPLEEEMNGNMRYSINGISVLAIGDCMSPRDDSYRYLIIREDGRLYSRWEDKGSLIF
jgi:hypothetical protein